MEKSTLTEDKAEQTPTGGVLVGKREGQTIIHNKGSLSGYLVGKTHAEGGIKAVNKSTGQPLEMQGGEVVITAPAVSDQTKREFEGKMMTNREILSAINEKGGGVAFAKGGDIPKDIKRTGASYNYGGRTMTDHEIYKYIIGGHLAEGYSLREIASIHQVNLSELKEQVRMGMIAESEHTPSKREQMKIVKNHLFENPKYYTLLKKAGLEDGGKVKDNLVRDAKTGNTPARDLNNYNDVLDIDADGMVGAETGLFANGGDINEINSNLPNGWSFWAKNGSWLNNVLEYNAKNETLLFAGINPDRYTKYDKVLSTLSEFMDSIQKTLSDRINNDFASRFEIIFDIKAEFGSNLICKVGTRWTRDITNVRFDMFDALINIEDGKVTFDKEQVEKYMLRQTQNYINGLNDNFISYSLVWYLTVEAMLDYFKAKPNWLNPSEIEGLEYKWSSGDIIAKSLNQKYNLNLNVNRYYATGGDVKPYDANMEGDSAHLIKEEEQLTSHNINEAIETLEILSSNATRKEKQDIKEATEVLKMLSQTN